MMTAEQLKGSILQLALQGKLVEQRPEEGTGKDVYKRLKQEQRAMIASGRIKQKHLLGPINAEETDFEIPDSWEWARIEECGYFISGYTPKNDQLSQEGIIPYFKVSDMNTIGNEKFLKITENYLSTSIKEPRCYEEGTIVYPKNGGAVFTNKKRILAQKSVVDLNTGGYKPFNLLDFDYIYLLYTSIDFKQCYKGTALPTIDMDKLRKRVFPIPPLAEQKRIVAKIEELMPFVDQYAAASTKLNTLNASFPEMMRKSILQEAVQGKLVPQDPNDEPASFLLKKIAEEKKRLIKEGKIKKDKNTSRIVREGNSWFEFADGQKTCIDEEIPFEIPDNWSWVRLNELGDYKKGPFGSALTKSMFVPAGPNSIKVYEQKNAIQKDWTLGEYYIRKEYYEEKMSGFTVEGGDVIVSCAGTIGETYVMPDDIELGIINQALMRMKVYEPMNVDYFLMYFDYVIKATAREQSKGSAIKNIPPFAVFKRILFPMPPLSEQNRILSRLTEILLEVDKLE